MDSRKVEHMTIRILGAILIVVGCGSFGAMLTFYHRREEKNLRQILSLLDTMECELQYHLTSLPELCRHAADNNCGTLKSIFAELAVELDKQISPNVAACMRTVLSKVKDIPRLTYGILDEFGKALGHFDMDGQLKSICAVRNECKRALENHIMNQHSRLRCYQTLSICVGVAIAILLV